MANRRKRTDELIWCYLTVAVCFATNLLVLLQHPAHASGWPGALDPSPAVLAPTTAGHAAYLSPASRARRIASARSATCNLLRILLTWFRTVLGLSTSCAAMSAFVEPCAISVR